MAKNAWTKLLFTLLEFDDQTVEDFSRTDARSSTMLSGCLRNFYSNEKNMEFEDRKDILGYVLRPTLNVSTIVTEEISHTRNYRDRKLNRDQSTYLPSCQSANH